MKLAPDAHSLSDQVCIYKTFEGEKSSYGFAFAVYAFQYHRIGRGWRALGLLESVTFTWFWIGSHADYDRLLSQL